MTKEDFMLNAQGHLVPASKVKPEDKLEHDLVLELFAQAYNLNISLFHFKNKAFSEVETLIELLLEKYGAKKGGRKGNMTLMSYDGLFRLQVTVADFIQFGPQLQVAKQLIDECIKEWSGGTNDNIKAMVNHAFRVDKSGEVNKANVLSLHKLNITDEKWLKAMEAITDSCKVVASKQYLRFASRPSPEAEWKTVSLDFAAV